MQKPSGYPYALIARLLNILFPTECPGCRKTSDSLSYAPFCTQCWQTISRYAGPSCRTCANPLPSGYASVCSSCIRKEPFYRNVTFFGLYDGLLAHAINEYKFRGIRRLAGPLAHLLSDCVCETYDGIVYVPLSIGRLRARGYNQSLLLAHLISKNKMTPLLLNGLIKSKATPPQAGLHADRRKTNLRNAFSATRVFHGMNLLLVDDVMTTGSTVNACAETLRQAGALSVDVLTIARTASLL